MCFHLTILRFLLRDTLHAYLAVLLIEMGACTQLVAMFAWAQVSGGNYVGVTKVLTCATATVATA